ncbi:gluconate 2-dehydrogenase subunit 3 family protein [Pseudoxanthomonas composti]|uniref:Gluconate 2-dehydrogenase subunit 3 family protein n=1 Tax=Pseudoxanthomonas composti TaxID=2137479 RepID=A0A4Q1JY00_9GAMM|nr:gluconate 2-dehydrogenase subunit 3 family protein [Pseudoxanthomonas composti]RXR07535.1 gluconate 2-dehydrogenase subunit 3 family protein [Pseudoxanthomonas composti]
MERRELLKMIAAATGAALVGNPSLLFAQAQLPVPGANNSFSPTEVAKLDEIAEVILPKTSTPGAKDAGVGLFMAQYVTDCCTKEQQDIFRAGLADIDKRSKGSFVALKPAARGDLLRTLDAEAKTVAMKNKAGAADKQTPPHYFTMMKQLVLFSFFTSEVGATQVLRYEAVPGRYDGDMPYEKGTPAWATG